MDRFVGIAINGVDLSERGVNILRDYKIGGTSITNTIFQGRNRSSYRLRAAVYAQKPISFTPVSYTHLDVYKRQGVHRATIHTATAS